MRWLLAPTESRIRVESKRFLAGERCPYISNRKYLRPGSNCHETTAETVPRKQFETRHDYDACPAGTR